MSQLDQSPKNQILALSNVDFGRLIGNKSASATDAVYLATRVFDITSSVQPHEQILYTPAAYQHAIEREIRTCAHSGPILLHVPTEQRVMQKAISQALQALGPGIGEFEIVGDLSSVRGRDSRSLILDLIVPSSSRQIEKRRHIAGNPIRQLDLTGGNALVQILSMVQESKSLKNLGDNGSARSGIVCPVKLLQCSSTALFWGNSLTLSTDYFEAMAKSQNLQVISPQAGQHQDQAGFIKSYHADDFRKMLDTVGCSLDIIALDNRILGYLVSFLDSNHLPTQGRRLLAALDAAGVLPDGTIGYAQVLQVTDRGREYGQILDINVFETLHESLLEKAKDAGLTHLVCEARGYPYPNTLAQRWYQAHGWKDSQISLSYPLENRGMDASAPSHFLGKIFVKEL